MPARGHKERKPSIFAGLFSFSVALNVHFQKQVEIIIAYRSNWISLDDLNDLLVFLIDLEYQSLQNNPLAHQRKKSAVSFQGMNLVIKKGGNYVIRKPKKVFHEFAKGKLGYLIEIHTKNKYEKNNTLFNIVHWSIHTR